LAGGAVAVIDLKADAKEAGSHGLPSAALRTDSASLQSANPMAEMAGGGGPGPCQFLQGAHPPCKMLIL
jgi:hypothetical protein